MQGVLSFTDFVDYIRENMEAAWEEGREIEVRRIRKNNGMELTALVLVRQDSSVSPTVYLEDYYQDYRNSGGEDPHPWFDLIMDRCRKADRSAGEMDLPDFSSFDSLKDQIVYRIISYERNREMLERSPHIRIHDLAVTFRCMVSVDDIAVASAGITDEQIRGWGIGMQDLLLAAEENTRRIFPEQIIPLEDYLFPRTGEAFCGEDMIYIAGNRQMVYGAAVILYEGLLDEFARRVDSNFYLLPSSVHEFLFVPDHGQFRLEELLAMVAEVNETVVSPQEFLSDSVYYYFKDQGRLICHERE